MKKMVLTKGIVLGLLLSFPVVSIASEHGQAAPAVQETGHEAPAEHAAPAHGEEAAGGHEAASDAHGGGHEGGGHHGPILSGVTDPIGTGFLTYMFIMSIFIIPIAVHNENKKHAHGHGGHDAHGGGHDVHGDAHGGHDAHVAAGGHDAHHGDSGHGSGAHGGH